MDTAVYSSSSVYGDDYVIAKPAGGATPATKTRTDAFGRVIRIQHYTKSDLSQWRDTVYEYDARGNRKKVTDEAGNIWSYVYDARGRLTDSYDPETGHSAFGFDDLDRRTKAIDAGERSVYTEYDAIGRVKATREGSESATPTREWEYDTLPGANGMLAATTRTPRAPARAHLHRDRLHHHAGCHPCTARRTSSTLAVSSTGRVRSHAVR